MAAREWQPLRGIWNLKKSPFDWLLKLEYYVISQSGVMLEMSCIPLALVRALYMIVLNHNK